MALQQRREEASLAFREHLQELRGRVIRMLLALLVGTALAFFFYEDILLFLMHPAREHIGTPGGKPIFTEPTEFLGVAVKVSLAVGMVFALPVILYQVVMFVSPGLTRKERRYLLALLPAGSLAFVAGAAFGYLVLFPAAFKFLLTFGGEVATAFIRIGPLLDLVMRLLLWMGLIFELPIVLFFLTKIGVVTPGMLRRYRRYALVLAFALGAIITPTIDPVNQTLVAVPMIVLYEAGIWLSHLAYRGRQSQSTDQ